jgi:hypothetical protein
MNETFIRNKYVIYKMQERESMPRKKNEFECLLSMPNLGQYVGKWIAIVDEKIVSIGNVGKEVFKEAKEKHPESTPLLVKVPSNSVMLL